MAGSQAEPLKRKGGKRLRLTEFSWLFLARDVTGGWVLSRHRKNSQVTGRSRKQSEALFK